MSTKAMSKAAPSKKESKASEAKISAKAAPKGKAAKAAAEAEAAPQPSVDPDELEEQEEAAEAAAAGSGGGNAAALAAANSTTEMSASFKNFRHHPDMENFYRFIYENDLRHEALAIIDQIMIEKTKRKQVKFAKSQAH